MSNIPGTDAKCVEEARPLYEKKKEISLKDTSDLMLSPFYKDRFVAEYVQLKIRYEKLKHLMNKWDAFNEKNVNIMCKYPTEQIESSYVGRLSAALGFNPTCPYSLLKDQQRQMGELLHTLEIRALMEDIDLTKFIVKVW